MKKKKQQIILNLFFTDFVITISFIKEEPFKEQTSCIFYMHYTSILFVWLKIKESICNDTHCKTWIL